MRTRTKLMIVIAILNVVIVLQMLSCQAEAKDEAAPPDNALCAAYPPDGEFLEVVSQFSSRFSARHRACFRVGNEIQCWELFACQR